MRICYFSFDYRKNVPSFERSWMHFDKSPINWASFYRTRQFLFFSSKFFFFLKKKKTRKWPGKRSIQSYIFNAARIVILYSHLHIHKTTFGLYLCTVFFLNPGRFTMFFLFSIKKKHFEIFFFFFFLKNKK